MTIMRHLLGLLAVAAGLMLAAAPAAAQQPCGGTYTIRPGDSLADVAARCGTSIPALLAANPGVRDERDLVVGEPVRIPRPGTNPTPVEACGAFYTVRVGDTVEEVAAKCGLTVPLLLAANPALQDPDNMNAGGSIRIPDLPRVDPAFQPVIVGGPGTEAAPEAARAAARPDTTAEPEPWLRFEGVLRDGARCTILRTPDGTEVGIAGGAGPGFEPGDRVVVTGPAAPADSCDTPRAVTVRIMWRP